MKDRCNWATDDPLYISYHDTEWGVPLRQDPALFEFLVLETFQSGLSWITILRKREHFRNAFARFDVEQVAQFNEEKIEELLHDTGIVRNRSKIEATVRNARAFIAVQQEFRSFSNYIWGFVDGTPLQNDRLSMNEIPSRTELAERISKDMKKRGFKFIGPTVIYAFMQATGMVNDHTENCFRHREVQRL